MPSRSITLRNYRCFDWNHPATLSFEDGIVAIVGPNNSGKSSVLRSVFELRHFFSNAVQYLVSNGRPQLSLQGISDSSELVSNHKGNIFHVEIACSVEEADYSLCPNYAASLIFEFNVEHMTCSPIKATYRNNYNQGFVLEYNEIKGGARLDAGVVNYPEKTIAVSYKAILDFASDIGSSKYFPAFRNAINEGGNNYYDIPVGTLLVQTWDLWKAGSLKAQKIAIGKVEIEIAKLLGFKSLQINADQQGKTLDITIDGKPHKLYEVGSGIAQLIIVLASALVMKPKYILIDEPEISLHPALQLNFLSALASYAEKGLIYSTHSLGLARSTAQKIYSTHKVADGGSEIVPFNPSSINFSEWLGELSYSSRAELRCENLLLVEGPTDVLFIQEFLRKLEKDSKFVVMQLGGSTLINSKIGIHLDEITRLIDPSNIWVFIDSERKSPSEEISQDRLDFLEECNRRGVKAQASERRATENYLGTRAIQAVLGPDYQELEPFQLLKDAPKKWSKANNWRIARETSFDEIKDTDFGKFLLSL